MVRIQNWNRTSTKMTANDTNGTVWATRVQPMTEDVPNTVDNNHSKNNENNRARTDYKLEFKEFGGNTTLHGLRYVADSDMHILRRYAEVFRL